MGRWTKSKDKSACFIMELPLHYSLSERRELDTIFRLSNDLKNKLIAFYKKQLTEMTRTRVWRENTKAIADVFKKYATKMEDAVKKGDDAALKSLQGQQKEELEPLYEVRNAQMAKYQFSRNDFEKKLNFYRRCYSAHVGSNVGQVIADDTWDAFKSYLFGNGKEVHFSRYDQFLSISGKNNKANIIFLRDSMKLTVGIGKRKLRLRVKRSKDDRYGYEEEALSRKVRRCRIVRKAYPEGWRYFVQLTLEGDPPVKVDKTTGEVLHAMGKGRVGHDIGTQTLASCGDARTQIVELAPGALNLEKEIRRVKRAMDRSRKVTNPKMFKPNGTVVRKNQLPSECLTWWGARKWYKSKNYRRMERYLRYLYRKQRDLRLKRHRELANQLVALGDVHYIEEMQFRALAKRAKETKRTKSGKFLSKKRFGRSIANKAPALFVKTLEKAVLKQGGQFIRINTWEAKASQFNHMTGRYTKKKLSQRWNNMPDGSRIQRDLYSAFLIQHTNEDLKSFDQEQCGKDFPAFRKLHDIEISRINGQKLPSSIGLSA